MEKANSLGLMAGHMKEIILEIKSKEKVSLLGQMEDNQSEIGLEGIQMELLIIKINKDRFKREFGKMESILIGLKIKM